MGFLVTLQLLLYIRKLLFSYSHIIFILFKGLTITFLRGGGDKDTFVSRYVVFHFSLTIYPPKESY